MQSGRAAGLMAIEKAMRMIEEDPSLLVLAGGVDTYYDLYVLGTLDMENRINSELTMDGFTPGEGAGFLLLTSEENAAADGFDILGRINAATSGEESGHMYSEEPYRGEGLATAVTEALVGLESNEMEIKTVFSSMNGENHFAKEWSVAYLRNQEKINTDFAMEHPADCFGDIGAASGPVMIGLALTGFAKDYIKRPALVYASSDRAPRAACVVSSDKKG
jgi:3-oxoacyl-[acyl-carrier-protein] synthase-1